MQGKVIKPIYIMLNVITLEIFSPPPYPKIMNFMVKGPKNGKFLDFCFVFEKGVYIALFIQNIKFLSTFMKKIGFEVLCRLKL